MMALDDEIRPDARMLPGLIAFHERNGNWDQVAKLRDWLAEAEHDKAGAAEDELTEEDYQNADPDETVITTSLGCYRREIRYRLFDREITDPSQLTKWRPRFLPAIGLSADQIRVVNRFNDAIGFPIGSDVELLSELPHKSPFGIDLRDGRLPGDVHDVVRRLMYGETTFRAASVLLGSRGLSKIPPHQRACSVVIRHAKMAANYRRMAIMDQHHGESWLIEATLREFPGAKPDWGLTLKVVNKNDALLVLQNTDGVADKQVYGGISSRGCPIVLRDGR